MAEFWNAMRVVEKIDGKIRTVGFEISNSGASKIRLLMQSELSLDEQRAFAKWVCKALNQCSAIDASAEQSK